MAQVAPAMSHSPPSAPRRPKGILKNSSSYQQISPDARTSPLSEAVSPMDTAPTAGEARPTLSQREMSEREIVQMNTELNAGEQRRNSSNPRGSISRRQSELGYGTPASQEEPNMQRLKWDEANLYLNEGQMGGKMKIDEPKTPFVGHYDPAEDEDIDDLPTVDPAGVVVDELEKRQTKNPRETDIPGLDLGEPEVDPAKRRNSDGERKVLVNSDPMDVDGGRHGEDKEEDMSHEELEKHRKFEQMRKKHYEMKNIKNLLGHGADELDGVEDNA